jgi:hypothetical protein
VLLARFGAFPFLFLAPVAQLQRFLDLFGPSLFLFLAPASESACVPFERRVSFEPLIFRILFIRLTLCR